jgi:alanine racemase
VLPISPKPNHRCWAEIDLLSLERNLFRIKSALPPHLTYVAVVKADAYGHGLGPLVSRLLQIDVSMFAVANLQEAREVRHIGGGWPILILSPALPEDYPAIVEQGFLPTLSSAGEIASLNDTASQQNKTIAVHLKIDTGMGRAGIWHEEASLLFQALTEAPHLSIAGCYTHFSDPTHDDAFTAEQRQRFLAAVAPYRQSRWLLHADNSAGLESFHSKSPFNAVRIGLLQFGINPYPGALLGNLPVEPVLSFHTRLSLIKELPPDTGVSYGQTFRTTRRTRIGLLSAGYADGIPIALSNRGSVLVQGKRCPIIGRVTMDQTIVDLTECPAAAIGDIVTLIGRQEGSTISLSEFSEAAHSIPWEVLTGLSKRVVRLYRNGLA